MTENPLLQNSALPLFDKIDAKDALPAISMLIDKNLTAIEEAVKEQNFSFESLILPLDEREDVLNKAWSMVSHLNAVTNTPALREAYNLCLEKLTDYANKIGQNTALYSAYVAIKESAHFAQLNQAQQKVITNALQDFKLAGVALEKEKKERYASLNQALSKLQSQFQDNVMDATDSWHYDTQNSEELMGIPPQALLLAKQAASSANVPGWRLTLDYPCFSAVITYADNRALRQKIHEAYHTRASEIGPHDKKWDNSENMENIIKIRHDMARLLGFANYAEKSLAKKMAKKPEAVLSFLNTLAKRAKPFAEKEYAELVAFAREEDNIDVLAPHDLAYYSEKLKQRKYALSDEMLRPYFPVDTVLQGMFEVVKRLYGVNCVEKKTFPSWHSSVRFFELFDNQNQVIGAFYLDLYARPQKRGGAWMDEARVRRRDLKGEIQKPIAFLTCNFRSGTESIPSLLSHDEVLTLFHEFGHGLHHLLTKGEYMSISGINGVAWDAVELPSQFMENWCWEEEAIDFISGHYQDQKPLPKEFLQNLLRLRNFQAGMMLMRQIEFSLFDFRLHLEFNPEKGPRIQEILDEVRALTAVTPVAPYSRFQHSFSHIFAGGYAAGYYSYLWAEVLSQDAFAKFEEEGIFNTQTGKAFLQEILEKGGSVDAALLFKNFRGREPSMDPLLRHRGLVVVDG